MKVHMRSTVRTVLPLAIGMMMVLVLSRLVVSLHLVPSSSMAPTLWPGDLVLVQRSRSARTPKLYRVAPFKLPGRSDLIVKRIMGVPGDTLEMRGGVVVRNGIQVSLSLPSRPWAPSYAHTDTIVVRKPNAVEVAKLRHLRSVGHNPIGIDRWGRQAVKPRSSPPSWSTINSPISDSLVDFDNWGPFIVPRDSVFTMGDNRWTSLDSRLLGPMPISAIVGEAKVVVFSIHLRAAGGIPFLENINPHWSRVGLPIR